MIHPEHGSDFMPLFQRPEEARPHPRNEPDILIGMLNVSREYPELQALRRECERSTGQRYIRILLWTGSSVGLAPQLRVEDFGATAARATTTDILHVEVRKDLCFYIGREEQYERVTTLHFEPDAAHLIRRIRGFMPLPWWMVEIVDQMMLGEKRDFAAEPITIKTKERKIQL